MQLPARRFAEVVVLSPVGRIDQATSDGFKVSLAAFLDGCVAGGDSLVLDLGGVDYVSSVGLRVLMLAAKQAKAQGGTVVVAALQPLVREIFDISRFSLVFETFGSVRDALQRVSPAALAASESL
jgi:anti-sigma B factor antagonist/stage II sporulation protein AA (anti-sigma F factor antagonist)